MRCAVWRVSCWKGHRSVTDPALHGLVTLVSEALTRSGETLPPWVRVRDEGRVLSVADGVMRIGGLPNAAAEEVLHVGADGRALVLGLEPGVIHAVLLAGSQPRQGTAVRSVGEIAQVPVGDVLLGRVVDPLGLPLDGGAKPNAHAWRPVHRPAPQIHERAAIRRPLHTGTLAIDAMFPIGRGQRQLIVGDEGTGKTSIALDAMLAQRHTGVICVYVAVGRRRDEVARIQHALANSGVRHVIVAAAADESAGQRYLSPYAGCAMAEAFTERGEDVLVIYDDLSAHAVAWRELSLLMRRPPGREAYPGDIFYQHARLLERATQLSPERGGGSLTALPLAVLESGRIAGYIPTNLISITDGQLVLSQELFAAGDKPAIDARLSVSRVGGKAQPQAISALASKLRLDFAGFLELEAFSRLGTRLEPVAQRRLDQGRRVRRLLRAPRLSPLSLFDEVVRLCWVNAPDLLLPVPEAEVEQVAIDLCQHVAAALPAVVLAVTRDAVLNDADRRAIVLRMTTHLTARGWIKRADAP